MMEQVCRQLRVAFQHVAANRGAPGPDRQSIEQVRAHMEELLPALEAALRTESYRPGDIRRVWIPKAGGDGRRGLGIPNVVDRVVSEAVRLVLEPLYEPTFHEASHGFRPKRSCHTAVERARSFFDSDDAQVRVAVEAELKKLSNEFTDWTFTASFGGK